MPGTTAARDTTSGTGTVPGWAGTAAGTAAVGGPGLLQHVTRCPGLARLTRRPGLSDWHD